MREWDAGGDPRSSPTEIARPAAPALEATSARGVRARAAGKIVTLSAPGARTVVLRGHCKPVTAVSFSRDGRLLVTASRDYDARLWDGMTARRVGLLRGHFGPVADAAFSPDGRWVVTAGPLAAGLWEVAEERMLFFLRGHEERLTAARFAGPRTIVTSDRSGEVREYRCSLCGGLGELRELAARRRALTGRTPTAAERGL